jgi:hypothetical protein
LVVSLGIIGLGEMLAGKWHIVGLEPGKNPDGTALAPYLDSISTPGLFFLIGSFAVAAFLGGFISIKMARRFSSGMTVPVVTGVLIMLLGAIDLFLIVPYHPGWVIAVCLLLCIPMSLLGYRFARQPKDAYRPSMSAQSQS